MGLCRTGVNKLRLLVQTQLIICFCRARKLRIVSHFSMVGKKLFKNNILQHMKVI